MLPDDQLQVNRENTEWFINQDPVTVSLVPNPKVKTGSGATRSVSGSPRTAQTVMMIPLAGAYGGIQTADDGVSRRFEFIMLMKHDAVVELGDSFKVGDAEFSVVGFKVDNGYEKRAVVHGFGKEIKWA
jgi:hypothetical protein